jgi:hypothetical protein
VVWRVGAAKLNRSRMHQRISLRKEYIRAVSNCWVFVFCTLEGAANE